MHYKYSGRFTLLGLIESTVAGLAVGFPLALFYAWGIIRIPEEHLACFATLGYGALIGTVVALVARLGKVRNVQIVVVVAICTAIVSLYWSWAFWVTDIFHTYGQDELSAFALMQRPHALWDLVRQINQHGTWGATADNPTKGTELWILWAVEAVAVPGIAGSVALTWIQAQPFCEACKLWCSSSEKLCLSPVGNLAQVKLQIQQHDFSFLQKLGIGRKNAVHLHAELHSCPSCRELNTLTLRQTAVPQRRFRSPHVTLANKLLVSHMEAESFRHTAAGLKQLSKATHA